MDLNSFVGFRCAPLLLLTLGALLVTTQGFGPKKLYSLAFDRDISSVSVVNRQLIITAPYEISVIDNVQWKFRQRGRMVPRIINKDIADPRMIGRIPANTFKGDKSPSYWVSSRGTNHTNGAIHVLKQTTDYSILGDITIDSGWNYERAQWVDMNKDNRRDCLTARYRGGVGQMLWFEQPSGQTIWGQRIIHEGLADGNFVGFLYDKKTYIAVAGNQFNTLGLYWTMHPRNNWAFSRQVRHRVVDNYGKYYDVQYVDLNKDGRPDVLTTTVQIASSRGHVLGYEIPYDIQNAIWDRHVLAGGFTGDYSPGKATAFWPNKWKRKSDRPSIFLTGGSEATLYILSPTPKTKGWGYFKSELSAGVGIPGIPFITDLNGDSFPEIFVPQGGHVHVFSYDYQASAADPPKKRGSSSSSAGKVTITKPPVKFRNPFFRPLPSVPPPAIGPNAAPVGPRPPKPPSGAVSSSAGGGGTWSNPGGSFPSSGNPSPPRAPTLVTQNRPQNTPLPAPIAPQPNAPHSPLNPFGNGNTAARPPYSNDAVILGSDGWLYTRTGYSPQFLERSNTSVPPAVDTSDNLHPTGTDQPYLPGSETLPPDYDYDIAPPNLVLWVTAESFIYRQEASDVCEVNNQVLCSLAQLQDAVRIGGVVPDFEWGWFEMENRAANLQGCSPGEVRWEGFQCYNGDVSHTPVLQETSLPSLCCSVIKGANVTKQKFVRKTDAQQECEKSSRHLCSLEEMLDVWDQSSQKGIVSGWFSGENHLVKMTHSCDVNSMSWPGYNCIAGKLEVTAVTTVVQRHAFCCGDANRNVASSLLLSLALALLWFTVL